MFIATLIVTILFGLIIASFAIQNTGNISLNFFTYTIPNVPTYLAIIGALLIGLLFAWLISMMKGIETGFMLRGKEGKIKASTRENEELTRKIHQLELENARLSTAVNLPTDDKSL